jgi:hypothetical protein
MERKCIRCHQPLPLREALAFGGLHEDCYADHVYEQAPTLPGTSSPLSTLTRQNLGYGLGLPPLPLGGD